MPHRSHGRAHKNLTSLTVAIDTNQIASANAASMMLIRLGGWGWIYVQKTDLLDVELANAPAYKILSLETASAEHAEIMGPYVTFAPTRQDIVRLHAVFKIVFPYAEPGGIRPNNVRDAMHVATAIRSRVSAFVTGDKKILKAAADLAAAFDGFRVLSPDQALGDAMQRIRSLRKLHNLEPQRGPLPALPSNADVDKCLGSERSTLKV